MSQWVILEVATFYANIATMLAILAYARCAPSDMTSDSLELTDAIFRIKIEPTSNEILFSDIRIYYARYIDELKADITAVHS